MSEAPRFFHLDVNVIDDLHTGTGTGSGDIDALVMRDRHGRPVIRASHLKGLLREAGDEAIECGLITQGELGTLLGHDVFDRSSAKSTATQRGALRLRSLRVTEDRNGAPLVWGSSARETNSRRPAEDTLRYVEYVAAGTTFQAQGFLDDPNLMSAFETLLGRVDRMGGNRNRGAGLVQVAWTWRQPEQQKPEPPNGKTCLRLVLRNLEPLCLPATAHPGNLIPTQSFIRGQSLRGALMAWAIRRKGVIPDLSKVSIGDALPLPEGVDIAADVIPIPLSVMTEKPRGGSADLPWWAQGARGVTFDGLGKKREPDKEKPKRPGAHEYLCRQDSGLEWLRFTPEMNVRLRNQTPKAGSRAKANLFSLEEIAEDTLFQADLLFDDEVAAAKFAGLFEPLLSRNDWLATGRGGQPVQVAAVHWRQPNKHTIRNEDAWTLTLASDLVLRGSNLGFLVDLDIDTLCALAGIEKQEGWRIKDRVVETEAIHGFNAVSGMHRSPVIAIRRGSCWMISGPNSGELATRLSRAMGERTREGCGRFILDMQPIGKLDKPADTKSAPLENRQEVLLSRAQTLMNKCDGSTVPSLSQLQWLRERALAISAGIDRGDEKSKSASEELRKLLDKIEKAPRTRPQGGGAWENFPVKPLIEAIDLLDDVRERGRLISYLVQGLAPHVKNTKDKRS